MTPAQLRRELRARRRELRQALPALRKRGKERVELLPAVRQERSRRRRRRAVMVALLVLLACLRSCVCTPGRALFQPAPPKPPAVAQKPPQPPAPPAKREPLRVSVKPKARPKLRDAQRAAPGWLDDFYLQVSARAPRLVECFAQADRPGGVRWSASLNAASGAVSDHELELAGVSAELGREQRACVVRVLSEPRYHLTPGPLEALPNRVSLLIEF